MVPLETLYFEFGSLSTTSIVMTDTMYLPKIMVSLFWDTRYVSQKNMLNKKYAKLNSPFMDTSFMNPKGNDYKSVCLCAHLRGPGAQRYEIFFWLPP